jgi:hypothetical protein
MSATEHNNGEWYVEGNPRWPYDRFMRTYYLKPMRYSFCREAHNRTLDQLRKADPEDYFRNTAKVAISL